MIWHMSNRDMVLYKDRELEDKLVYNELRDWSILYDELHYLNKVRILKDVTRLSHAQ